MKKATKLTIKYEGGSKDGQVEVFPLAGVTELSIGRDSSSALQFGESEDLVSRNHAKIVLYGEDMSRLEIVDLGSSHGTFVNQQRVADFMTLRSGDVVHCGAGGPELMLELDFDPQPPANATHIPHEGAIKAPENPEIGDPVEGPENADTGERSRNWVLIVTALILVGVVIVVAFLMKQG